MRTFTFNNVDAVRFVNALRRSFGTDCPLTMITAAARSGDSCVHIAIDMWSEDIAGILAQIYYEELMNT